MANPFDYIAVFDSGVGGISVLRELVRQMPGERFLYFGDSANAPYGTRPTQQVRELTVAAAEQLLSRGVKALVVACNTATSAAIDCLRQRHPDKIIVGIEPALKLAADQFPQGRIGIMATPVTLREDRFLQQLGRFPQVQSVLLPAPGLVDLIEAGKLDTPETQALLTQILSPYVGKLDALVLGCTHYPFVKKGIARILGPETLLLDGSEGTAKETRRRLEAAGLLSQGAGSVTIENSLGTAAVLALSHRLLQE